MGVHDGIEELTKVMCHINVPHMRKATIRELKHDMTTVLSWVAGGESVEILRRDLPVALLSPPKRSTVARPDFAARLKAIYGPRVLAGSGSDLVSESRGDS